MEFKPRFVAKYEKLTNFTEYRKAVEQFPKRCIRVNTLKATVSELKERLATLSLTSIPWCSESFYVEGKRDLGNLPEHQQGLFFVQSPTSFLPVLALNPQPGELVLDLCSAPGGKTTHLAAHMQNQGLIVANEKDPARVHILIKNLERCGVRNVIVTQMNALQMTGHFEKILLDAPCSASGTILGNTKGSRKTLKEWNPNTIKRLAGLQKQLLHHAYSLLKPNGTLVYSTCSLEPEEDEQQIEEFITATRAQLESVTFPGLIAEGSLWKKVWPQFQSTEGFFVALLTKG